MKNNTIPLLVTADMNNGLGIKNSNNSVVERTKELVVDVGTDKIQNEIQKISNNMVELFDKIDDETSKFQLDEVEIALAITAEGKIGILTAEMQSNVQRSVKLVFKRRESK